MDRLLGYVALPTKGGRMPSAKVTMILKSKTDISDEQIAVLSDKEAWGLVYTLKPPKTQLQKAVNQICFTGFSPADKARLSQIAMDQGLDVVKSVTRALAYLVTG